MNYAYGRDAYRLLWGEERLRALQKDFIKPG